MSPSRSFLRNPAFILLWLLALARSLPAMAAPQAAIASAHPLATAAGFEILDRGGNAFDAAVAVAAALAVVEPAGSGLGGGGFWLLRRAADGRTVMVDGREKAPFAATRTMYLGQDGRPVPKLSLNGALAAAIPGLPAALVHLAVNYGRLPLAASLAPAIRHAAEGFAVSERQARITAFRVDALGENPAAAGLFLVDGKPPPPGTRLVQADLAATLGRLSKLGSAGFYEGVTAARLVEGVRAGGGIWSLDDLSGYRVVEREPLRGTYRGIRIMVPPPPSAGGVGVIQMLNVLGDYDLQGLPSAIRKHLVVEAMRRAYHDREQHLGDPDFVAIPLLRLLSPNYAAGLRTTIRFDRALPSSALAQPWSPTPVGEHTTHYSILDREGNAVAATLSINNAYGAAFVVPGTGVLLNDEMDDFAVDPGTSNLYRLVGGEPNAIAPGKRMLSSMTPSFLDDGNRFAILGTPGGSRIISMVLLAALDFADGHGPESWVSLPRFHHQYLPDLIEYEKEALSAGEMAELGRMGHALKPVERAYGNMQAVLWDRKADRVSAASDPRGEGAAGVR